MLSKENVEGLKKLGAECDRIDKINDARDKKGLLPESNCAAWQIHGIANAISSRRFNAAVKDMPFEENCRRTRLQVDFLNGKIDKAPWDDIYDEEKHKPCPSGGIHETIKWILEYAEDVDFKYADFEPDEDVVFDEEDYTK